MTRRVRRNRTAAFKAKVASAALRPEKTLADLAQHLTCTRTTSWMGRLFFLGYGDYAFI
jgi:transposase